MKRIVEVVKTRRFVVLCLSVLFLIAAYTILKELQNSIFISLVGKEYVPYAKIGSGLVIIPIILFYSYCIDKTSNRILFGYMLLIMSVLGILFACLLGTDIGLYNTKPDTFRVLGWLFYWYLDCMLPLQVSTFWALSNDLHNVEDARSSYSLLVLGSKVGGMLGAGIGYIFSVIEINSLNGILKTQILIFFSSLLFGMTAFLILKYCTSTKLQDGYIQTLDKNPAGTILKDAKLFHGNDMLAGLKLLIKKPYTLGIFGTVFCFEIVNQVVNYQRVIFNSDHSSSIENMNAIMYSQIFFTHFCGGILALIGTTFLLKVLGIRRSLIITPLLVFLLVMQFIFLRGADSLIVAYVGIHIIAYAIASPLRESLYIITSRDIKFKVKAWIDSFGGRSSKVVGQSLNAVLGKVNATLGSNVFYSTCCIVLCSILACWALIAFLLGNKYQKCIDTNETIR